MIKQCNESKKMKKKGKMIICYHIWIQLNEISPLFNLKEGEYLGISENCRCCRYGVALETKELAQEFLDALEPIFKKRYGENVLSYGIGEVGVPPTKDSIADIQQKSNLVRWRLEKSDFDPKSKPCIA